MMVWQSCHSWQLSQFLPNASTLRSRVIDVIEKLPKALSGSLAGVRTKLVLLPVLLLSACCI
jgi:hypothetical protein